MSRPKSAIRRPVAARRTQEERSSATRGRLVRAAMQLLKKQGYAGMRVEEVSRISKISRGAQTHHFATRDSLVLAAVEQIFRESEETTLARIAAIEPDDDAVRALVDDAVDFFLGPYFLVTVDLLSFAERGGLFRKTILASAKNHRSKVERAWALVLGARGASAGEATEAIWLAFNVVRGMAVRRFIDDDVATERQLERLREIVAARLPAKVARAKRRAAS